MSVIGTRLAAELGPSRVDLQQELAAAVRRMPPAQAHVLVGQAGEVPAVRMATAGEEGVVRGLVWNVSFLCVVCYHRCVQVAVAPNAAAVGGAPAAPVVVHGAGDGPVPLVSHVLAPVLAVAGAAAPCAAAAPAVVESMVFTDAAPRVLPMHTAAPAASMDDAVAALFAAAPIGASKKHPSKRARLASHARAW